MDAIVPLCYFVVRITAPKSPEGDLYKDHSLKPLRGFGGITKLGTKKN